MPGIRVLRLGHRIGRDQRATTHVALVARAYGADGVIISGERDEALIRRVMDVVETWGGDFKAEYRRDWRRVIHEWKRTGGVIIHLTMYGINLPDIIGEVRAEWRKRPLLVVVGGEKVPGELFHLADYNVAITNQPHSEIAALATFLDWLQEGRELRRGFPGARLRVIPQRRGKKVVRVQDRYIKPRETRPEGGR